MMGRSLTASREKTARLWKADSGSLLAAFQGYDEVQSAAFKGWGLRSSQGALLRKAEAFGTEPLHPTPGSVLQFQKYG
jgi:hypothetical protein